MSATDDYWADLKAFIAEWYRPLEPRDGLPLGEIERAEKRLGLRLPEVLREFYQIAGMYLPYGDRWDRLKSLDIRKQDEAELLLCVYYDELRFNHYYVRLSQIKDSDPPVLIGDEYDAFDEVGTISEWLFHLMVHKTVEVGAGYRNSAYSLYCPPRVMLNGVDLLFSMGLYADEYWAGDGILIWSTDRVRWLRLLAKNQEIGKAFVCENQEHLIWKQMLTS